MSPHGFYAMVVILFSQVVPLVSLASVQSLYDKVRERIAPAVVIERAAIQTFQSSTEVATWPPGRARTELIASFPNPAVAP
jgi:hypothetical protein